MLKGYRIAFEIPESVVGAYTLDTVDYEAHRTLVSYSGDSHDPMLLEAMRKSLKTKCEVWRYENEVRLTISLSSCLQVVDTDGQAVNYLSFPSSWIVGVDCGIRSNKSSDDNIVSLVKERYPQAGVSKAGFHTTEYQLEYVPMYRCT